MSMTSKPRGEYSAALLTPITSQAVSSVAKFKVFNTLVNCMKPVGLSKLFSVWQCCSLGFCVLHINGILLCRNCANIEYHHERMNREGFTVACLHLTLLSNSSPHFNDTTPEVTDTKAEDDEEDQSLTVHPVPLTIQSLQTACLRPDGGLEIEKTHIYRCSSELNEGKVNLYGCKW